MAQRTGIEWTDSTWNPVTGCTQVSPGCDNCYALTLANRLLRSHYTARAPERDTPSSRLDPFSVRTWPERLTEPLRWTEPRRVFVNSMGDLFHAHVPVTFVQAVFEVMLTADSHIYQVLTKRPARMDRFIRQNLRWVGADGVPDHIWLGTSVESQDVAYRVNQLRR